MGTKRIIAGLLSAVMCGSLLTACADGGAKSADMHKLYVRDETKSREITVTFENSSSGEKTDVKMEKTDEIDDCFIFSCEGDAARYNRAYITYDGSKNLGVAFNRYVSGWTITSYGLLPFTEGEEYTGNVDYKTESFDYKSGQKEIYIWTPEDYDPDSEEKYSTVYLLDGENKISRDFPDAMNLGCWNAAESVESMMKLSDHKAIVVAISNPEFTRYDELVPDLGELSHGITFTSYKQGKLFCDFVTEKVVPFVEKNYNVYTDAAHNSIGGSSLAGLESFYIGMEHPEKFGTIGAFSPTFASFYTSTWNKYLDEKTFDESSPFIYFYSGDEKDNEWSAKGMISILQKRNYPEDKMVYNKYPGGKHTIAYWRNVFPEYLEAAFDKRVDALEGKPLLGKFDIIPDYEEYLDK